MLGRSPIIRPPTTVVVRKVAPRCKLPYRVLFEIKPRHYTSSSNTSHPSPDSHTTFRTFQDRHVGPNASEAQHMLKELGYNSMDAFVDDTIPPSIKIDPHIISNETIPPVEEAGLLKLARSLGKSNKSFKSYIGMGYHNAVVPSPILRNIMENPAWYTPYTPYQAEIAQGRLESLLNFQTLVTSMTAMDIANASLLDEATAAAEAMIMCFALTGHKKPIFLVDKGISPQTLAVLRTRAKGFNIDLRVATALDLLDETTAIPLEEVCGVLVQYPNVDGEIQDYSHLTTKVHKHGGMVACATDLLALAILKPPGEWGADIVFGNSARFGVPSGFGGPHAAFFACRGDHKRKMPGRLVGVTKDAQGNLAYRLALQTREQHIRREKATSNICTSQALLANMAAMYAVYHGPKGILKIAERVHRYTAALACTVEKMGFSVKNKQFFDTLTVHVDDASRVHAITKEAGINFRRIDANHVGITLDESVDLNELARIVRLFADASSRKVLPRDELLTHNYELPHPFKRTTKFLTQSVFNKHHSETELMRYIHHLESKDLSLVHAMIPLGSCTMKLNSATSMAPLTWSEFSNVHPFSPANQVAGYMSIIKEVESHLARITGFHSCSLQPNSGAAGEYAGLTIIREFHESQGDQMRDICLIPLSAHGTNPASAIMAGLKVVPIKTLSDGSLDLNDLSSKAEQHSSRLAAFMVTYPSTFGVFEEGIQKACEIVHQHGGLVYLDGANLNAQIGLTNPAVCGGDVCHLNLHKTFAIPHGGGGPGVGPVCVTEKLAPFLPSHPVFETGGKRAINAVSAAPFGSASILLISWAYIKMLGGNGLVRSSQIALLNANYIAHRLQEFYNIRFRNHNNRVAHELLIDLAEFEKSAGLKVTDFAKRLQDYGFHPPTCSWPIQTCMLIEPTESESLDELDRFCEALIQIRKEAQDIIDGHQPRENNVLKNAPHPMSAVVVDDKTWNRPYTRETAAYPLPWLREKKFWPSIARIDDAFGDLNLICECPSVEESQTADI